MKYAFVYLKIAGQVNERVVLEILCLSNNCILPFNLFLAKIRVLTVKHLKYILLQLNINIIQL